MTHKKRSRKGKAEPRTNSHGVATMKLPRDFDELPDHPFAEGAGDQLDPDLRHRLISEATFHRQMARGYDEGYEREDWLDAEAEVDHLVVGAKQR